MRIGFFLNNLDEEYQLSVYKSVKTTAIALGMDLICVQGEQLGRNEVKADDPKMTPFPSQHLIAADGILFLSSVLIDYPDMVFFSECNNLFTPIPIVSIGEQLMHFPSIVIKTQESMKVLMDHLIMFHGYRKFLFIGGPSHHNDNRIREQVFRKSISAFKSDIPNLEGTVINGGFSELTGMTIMRDYIGSHLEYPVDAVIAANDNMAIGALQTLRNQSDPRWKNCKVTGFDDIPQACLEVPALTTVHQPLDVLGELAVKTLRDCILGKKTPPIIYIESELKIRNSCGCNEYTSASREKLLQNRQDLGSRADHQSILAEHHLRNVSLLGQSLINVNGIHEIIPHLQLFLTNLGVKEFYLFLYPHPIERIQEEGELVFSHSMNTDISYSENPVRIGMRQFFAERIHNDQSVPHAWCLYHLRVGDEYLGLIVYEAADTVQPHICSGAIFIANTVKRLRILDDEKERSLYLEQQVELRTRDLKEEAQRRIAVEAEVLRISELERLRFSMDLHDDICQRLAGISMFCRSLTSGLSPEIMLPELSEMIDETLLRTRQYAHDSFPMELSTLGLHEALDSLCHSINKQARWHCVYTWSALLPSPLSPAQDINVYRIIQEALHNAVKHSKASCIWVTITDENNTFTATVKDNGIGNPQLNESNLLKNRRREGLGLRSMQYRAHQIGAKYRLLSSKTEGTLVEVQIPYQKRRNSSAKQRLPTE
ncbi:MAG: substrate-binding domain-containing protein [Treponema sp.]|jgi:signal transduction histidine kinase/DNA-binding LacI/PurR family transcriptional regulator|nr:substrate-binding domain-containing protein [Treponema sp.]